MNIIISKTYRELAKACSELVADYIRLHPGTLLCFAAGDTPMGIFKELAKLHKGGFVDLNSVWYVSLDEWVGLGYEDAGSCIQVMFDSFYNPAGILKDRIMFFDGKSSDLGNECRKVDSWIESKGCIGISILGIGMNGHLGFNEPGVGTEEKCIVVDLDSVTKKVGKKYFNGKDTTTQGITVGLKHLLDSDCAILLAEGERKAKIIKETIRGEITVMNPASALRNHSNCFCFLDSAAASLL